MFITNLLRGRNSQLLDWIRPKRLLSRRRRLMGNANRGYSRALRVETLEDRTLLTAYVVDTVHDNPLAGPEVTDGLISLREAIMAANTNAVFGDAPAGEGDGTVDTITFHPSLIGQTITLGGTELVITDDLSLTGPGVGELTISGDDASRVFWIEPGVTAAISQVTIAHGAARWGGGGICNEGALTITDSTLAENRTDSSDGGGIWNSGTMEIIRSTFSDNYAYWYGGAIANDWSGNVTIDDSDFSGNSAGANGGAIDNNQYGNDSPGILIISNSRFTENEARWSSFASGGAISNNGPATITDCRFEDNFSNRMAGAIVHSGYTHTMTVGNCTFANNSSRRWGGAIFNLGYGTTLHVLDSTFFGNATGEEGGAIENYYGTLDIANSTISGNSSSGQAGGIWNLGELKITNSTVFNNLVETGGGGLYQVSHRWFLDPELNNTIVAGNLTGEPDSHVPDDIYGMLGASSSHNLIGDAATAGGLTDGDDGNIVGNAGIGTIDITTVLAPNLADNGGPTLTHALVPGGPAVDVGDNHKAVDGEGNLLVYDQRGEGFARIVGGTVDIGAFEVQPRSVQIDVKPGSDPNSINLANKGVIAVAILTTEAFDALLVDASTVVFAGASAVHWAWEDVDGDGDLDLVLHFQTQDTQLADLYAQLLAEDLDEDGVLDSNRQTATVSLTGRTTTDDFFEGFDDLDLFLSGKQLRDLLQQLAATRA